MFHLDRIVLRKMCQSDRYYPKGTLDPSIFTFYLVFLSFRLKSLSLQVIEIIDWT